MASFNPIYGQGMSVAALETVALARQLARERVPPSQVVMGELAKIVDVPWRLAGAADHVFVAPDKPRVRRDRFMDAYGDRGPGGRRARSRGRPRVPPRVRTDRPALGAAAARADVAHLRQLHTAHGDATGSAPPAREPADLGEDTEVVMSRFTISVALAAALLGPVLVLGAGVLVGHRLWRHRPRPRT